VDAGASPGPQDWWTGFGDPALDTLIIESLAHNHDLQAAGARLEAAGAQARVAGAPLVPQIAAGVSASRRKQNFLGLPLPGAAGVTSSTANAFGASVSASWEIDLWGKLRAGQAAALADYQAAEAILAGARLSLAGQTSRAWFAAVEATRQVDLAQATVDNYQTSLEQVRKRYERGLRPSLDLRLTRAKAAAAAAVLQQRKIQLDGTLRQLEILLGRYPAAALSPTGDLPAVPGEIPGGLPADLVSRRPDLIAAERALAASRARVSQARRALYPQISLTASGGTSTAELGDLLKGDFSVWNVVGSIVQPLFQGGRLRANVKLAKSRAQQALALYAQTVLRAYAEVESALSTGTLLASQEAALRDAAEQATAARRLAEQRYASGLSDLVTVLEAQRSAYQAESQLLSVRRLRLDARVGLHLALGGGFPVRAHALSAATSPSTQGAHPR